MLKAGDPLQIVTKDYGIGEKVGQPASAENTPISQGTFNPIVRGQVGSENMTRSPVPKPCPGLIIPDYNVCGIPKQQTYEWLLKKHYAHRIPSITWAFGLYDENVLIGICTLGKPASPYLCNGVCGHHYSDRVLELNRLCLIDNTPQNAESYFISKCLKLLPSPAIIISYADDGQGHKGYIYQASNFLYTGATKERTDVFVGTGKHSRHYDKQTIDYSKRILRTIKHRYIYFLGSKKEKREMLLNLRYSIQPYPKGNNKNYDASYQPNIQGVLPL